MKKQTKKLTLAKETLRNLEESESLKNVAGGTIYNTGCDVCVSGVNTCGTCDCGPTQTGTSRYC
ncbi:MAG TPA: class I lanthipeptide [Thermoanaerobaculia bacterium]